MTSRFDTAVTLDIPIEMVRRHGLPMHITQAELDALNSNPPAWLAQSRANRTGKKPVWVTLECAICKQTEYARPKKWWPNFTFVYCHDHDESTLPATGSPDTVRSYTYGVGTQYNGVVDSPQ